MDGHSTEIVKGVNLCTSLIFTSGSRTEGPQKGRELWFERSPTPTNNAESTKMHHLKISTLAECIDSHESRDAWAQGLRPNGCIPSNSTTNGARANDSHSHAESVVAEIESMAEQLGRGLYRGLLRDLAKVWSPREIEDGKGCWSTCGLRNGA